MPPPLYQMTELFLAYFPTIILFAIFKAWFIIFYDIIPTTLLIAVFRLYFTMSDTTTTSIYTYRRTLQLFAKPQLIGTPINDLPPELLIQIFTACVSNEPLVPLVLRQVCWGWRNLVENSPQIWQSIVLDDTDVKFSERQAKLWAERSRPLKYDIELNIDDPDYILPLLSPLLPDVERWRNCRLGGKRDDEVFVAECNITSQSLTDLHLSLHDYDQDDADDDDPRVMFVSINSNRTNFALNVWVSRIPSPTLLPPLHFVNITISEGGSIGLHTQPKFILEFLTACPELESFHLLGFPHDGPVEGPLPLVYLPNLVTLHLKSTCFARAILCSLDTPQLQNLYLSHLNVDFELYEQHNEEGDSEDEAHDYSQSPSSDRATGMGLRKLIKQCNPPIRILEMDFCDMRTKDFIWVFDRLCLLEDFYIVASDMSNKVINLLRPITSLRNDDGVMRLRLPRLRKLRLLNCQRLGGRAIVEALTERVRWSDSRDPENTLMNVTISGCEGFSPLDRHDLAEVLRARLKT